MGFLTLAFLAVTAFAVSIAEATVIRRLLPVCPRAKRLANKQQSSEAFAESWLRSPGSRVAIIRRLLRSPGSRVESRRQKCFNGLTFGYSIPRRPAIESYETQSHKV